jgi:hypothetical protein
MRWTADLDTGAFYFYLADGLRPSRQVVINTGLVVDLADDGTTIGFEYYPAGNPVDEYTAKELLEFVAGNDLGDALWVVEQYVSPFAPGAPKPATAVAELDLQPA